MSLNNTKPHKYGCLMANIPEPVASQIREWNSTIPDHHLAVGGREDHCHITIKYGFEDDSPSTVSALKELLSRLMPFSVRLTTFSLFKGNEDGDVLKVGVESEKLHELNTYITNTFPCHDKYPTYIPHLTIAYLDPRFAESYTTQKAPFLNTELVISEVEWSDTHKNKTRIQLAGNSMKSMSHLNVTSGGALVGARIVTAPKVKSSFLNARMKALAYDVKAGFTGRKVDRRGRNICFSNGRRVSCNQEGGSAQKPKPKPKEKPSPEKVKQSIEQALQKSTVSATEAITLCNDILSLTVKQINDVKRELGLRASGRKHELATKLAQRVVDRIEQGRENAKKPRERKPKQEPQETQNEQAAEQGQRGDDGAGGTRDGTRDAETSGQVAEEAQRPADEGTGGERESDRQPASNRPAERIPAEIGEVNNRINRYERFFRNKGQHHVADWMGKLREHINAVGTDAALMSLAEESANLPTKGEAVQYWGVGTEEANWKNMGQFMEAYLDRNGIIAVTGDTSNPEQKLISALGAPDKYVADQDFKPEGMHFKNKLDEAKTLPGLEKSQDIGELMGKPVTHLTDEVITKLNETYGDGQWIVKCYDDNAAAGYGIFFPQRAAAIRNDARSTIWASGGELAKYGFSHLRDDKGKIVGIKHSSGDEYKFGTDKYNSTIQGDARFWGDKAASAADHENGSMLPEGSFMAQPAFKAVGISDAERAAGKTWHEKNEGRVHLVTRPNGNVEVIPHSTWLKGGNLPVVFEDEDTRAMAQAAKEAIEKIPLEARKGQVYAPDIMKTADGYRVVELNAQGDNNGSGYLHDNHFTIDAYTSYLAGRQPAHVSFIRKLLTKNKGEE